MKSATLMKILRVSITLVIFVLTVTVSAPVWSQTHIWSRTFGDVSTDWGLDILTLANGNTWVTGGFQGTVDFGGGPIASSGGWDGFFAQYDVAGAHILGAQVGSTGSDFVSAIAEDGLGNVIFVGSFEGTVNFGGGPLISAGSSDIFVAKYTSVGVHIWSMNFGDASGQGVDEVVVDPFDNVIVTGLIVGTVDFGGGALPTAGSFEGYVASFDASGNHIWSRSFASTGSDQGYGVAADASGNVFVTGKFANSVDFGGGALVSAGSFDIYAAKYSSTGTHLWSKRFGGTSSDIGYGVAVDAAGSAVITGHVATAVDLGGGTLPYSGSTDIFVLKLDAAGNHIWSRAMGNTSNDKGVGVAVDTSKTVFVTGDFTVGVDFGGGNILASGTDVFLARYDAAGNHLYSDGFGNPGIDNGDAVDVGVGTVAITGNSSSLIDFGGGILSNNGAADIFAAVFDIPPVISIQSIEDIGNDQGRSVRINFTRAGEDAIGASTPVLQYEAFRRIDALPAGVAVQRQRAQSFEDAQVSSRLTGWEFVGAVPAHGEDNYSMVVPTLADSTITNGLHLSSFFIRAATAGPVTFFDSPRDSGYSVDNLSPEAPLNLVVSIGDILSWDAVGAADWKHYTIYGGNTGDFASSTKIGATIATDFDVQVDPFAVYFVTATDFSGNEGDPGVTSNATGVAGPAYAGVLSVRAYPNPFNPSTTIAYTVPERGQVWVAVHDVQGKLVDKLVDGVTHDRGNYTMSYQPTLTAGVYFLTVRTSASATQASHKIVLVK